MEKQNIALIGFMATGKTSVGRILTERLGKDYKFIEMDEMIADEAGKSIPDIFHEDGEIRFREYEIAICKKVAQMEKVVISCGGGVILNKINIDFLKQTSHIVLLQASADEIYERALKDKVETRPVIDKEDPRAEIDSVLKFREPFYAAAAEITVNTEGKTIDEISEQILDIIQKKE